MRITVYSGSFSPLHIGHLAIMEYLSAWEGTDWTYLVVSPQNPFKDASSAGSSTRRYRAALATLQRHPGLRVWLDDIELRMPPPSYTIRTLDTLRRQEPDNEFTLVIGGDNLDAIRRWKDYRRILKEYGVAVYPRSGYDSVALRADLLMEDPAYRITLLDCPTVDMSSTQIREAAARGESVDDWLM
ncbi:MAG: nicotinate (nicotinamide) nucleotide adenylyltransferase [Bacteroidales bacterium]|nr:nicotinate (nicotinamide) nucleotide adenylyltransferase [Bacteroidales bacterium]